MAEYTIMPVKITDMKAVFDSTNVLLERLTLLIKSTIIMIIARAVREANAAAAVIKKDFKILWSFAL